MKYFGIFELVENPAVPDDELWVYDLHGKQVAKIINISKTHLAIRTYLDGMRYAAQLVREYEIENNKKYREQIAASIEEKAK